MSTEQSENRAESDVDLVIRQRFFPQQSKGVFVEVGAARPDFLSMSALYRQLGWTILAIEPNPAYGELYHAKGIEVLPYACGNEDKDDVDFCVVDSHNVGYKNGEVSFESWSSLSLKDSYAELKPDLDIKHINVKLRRLDTILREHAPTVEQIDIVSVDVEGWELEVLSGLTFARYKPRALVIENLFYEQKYRDFMEERGYVLWKCLPPNDIYVPANSIKGAERLVSALQGSAVTVLGRMRKYVRHILADMKSTSK